MGPTCVAAGPGPELTSSHGGSRCVTTIVPLKWLWRICASGFASTGPQVHLAGCLHSHSWPGAEGSSNNIVLCGPAQQLAGNAMEHLPVDSSLEEYSAALLLAGELQSHLPHITAQKWIWGCCNNHRGKGRPCWTCSTGSGHRIPITPPTKGFSTHWEIRGRHPY